MANPVGITGRDLVIENPCITYVSELEKYAVAYTHPTLAVVPAFRSHLPMTSKSFESYGVIMPEEDKDGGNIRLRSEDQIKHDCCRKQLKHCFAASGLRRENIMDSSSYSFSHTSNDLLFSLDGGRSRRSLNYEIVAQNAEEVQDTQNAFAVSMGPYLIESGQTQLLTTISIYRKPRAGAAALHECSRTSSLESHGQESKPDQRTVSSVTNLPIGVWRSVQ